MNLENLLGITRIDFLRWLSIYCINFCKDEDPDFNYADIFIDLTSFNYVIRIYLDKLELRFMSQEEDFNLKINADVYSILCSLKEDNDLFTLVDVEKWEEVLKILRINLTSMSKTSI